MSTDVQDPYLARCVSPTAALSTVIEGAAMEHAADRRLADSAPLWITHLDASPLLLQEEDRAGVFICQPAAQGFFHLLLH
jgi:hypothetical protein